MDKKEIEGILESLNKLNQAEQELLKELPGCTDPKRRTYIQMWLLRCPWERSAFLKTVIDKLTEELSPA